MKLYEVYSLLGCSKQNVSYWEFHSGSTQSRRSAFDVIQRSKKLFGLNKNETEALANCAGLSLMFEGGELIKNLNYHGRICDLYNGAMISERMLKYYKRTPTKQALTTLAVYFKFTVDETDNLLRKYGYCLSKSIAANMIITWFLKRKPSLAARNFWRK